MTASQGNGKSSPSDGGTLVTDAVRSHSGPAASYHWEKYEFVNKEMSYFIITRFIHIEYASIFLGGHKKLCCLHSGVYSCIQEFCFFGMSRYC